MILQLSNFNIQRGEFVLCSGINLTLKAGDMCHLIGANGSGKTTLLMQLAGLLPIAYDDSQSDSICSIIPTPVYISHQLGIHLDLNVQQNLQFLLALYGIQATTKQLTQALSWVGLDGYQNIPCKQLSAGQRRRVNLARLAPMTVKESPLWLLDEPFTALDKTMVAKLQTRLQQFSQAGGAVLITSHQTESLDTIANKQLNLSDYISSNHPKLEAF